MPQTNREKATALAAERAIEALSKINLAERCRLLGLTLPDQDGMLRLPAFGKTISLELPHFRPPPESPASPVELVLVLHYLLSEVPVESTGELLSFRDLPGGSFYWQPFQGRSVIPLVKTIGNDLALLRTRLNRYTWSPVKTGDLGAAIHIIGNLDITLIYRTGDEEFPASADILFDSCIKRVYNTEDAAAIATSICFGLIK
ncbi:MAG: DUF3786 domain-containing protein [bacterium]|nr:DUF3786 domain-containing protein [bacterium]